MSKKNWNDLIEKEQVILDRIVLRDVHVICNELMDCLEDDYDFSSINSWDFDDEPKEAFEYYIISNDLYKHLEKVGAYLIEYRGLEIWARCETGQSLNMDWELKQVAQNIQSWRDEIEEKQKANQEYLNSKYGWSK